MARKTRRQQAVKRLNLSEHTLDINIRRCRYNWFNFSEIEEYVRELTGSREYQYTAIKQVMIYLWGGAHPTVVDLANENFSRKPQLCRRFGSEEAFLRRIPLPDRLSGVVHLATGTGKSYLLFAIAYLSLVMGLTRRVLVLGPSSTIIEQGLWEKFRQLKDDPRLNSRLPAKYRGKIIRLLNDNDPMEDDAIIIENINAVYTFGGITDTFFKDTDDVLVLGDEIHHAYSHLRYAHERLVLDGDVNPDGRQNPAKEERLWMKFLRENPKITRHIGFTGTPYNQDEYFVDIIYNYSIKDAQEGRYIKEINNHVRTTTDEGNDQLTLDERFQIVLKNHLENREKYAYPEKKTGKRRVKPITLFICPNQKNASTRSEEFIQFLAKTEKSGQAVPEPDSLLMDRMRKKVICVISQVSQSEYKTELDHIQETDPAKPGGAVEFIFAVNKLSEGWDVDNVFQIVPMEERVFKSKLLISQVLGRGMRLPRDVPVGQFHAIYPTLTVTNHDSFADHIREMLDSVTQSDMYLSSFRLPEDTLPRGGLHFPVMNLNYVSTPKKVPVEDTGDAPSAGRLQLTGFEEKLGVTIQRTKDSKRYELARNFRTVDEMVYDIHQRFRLRSFESLHFDFGDVRVHDRYPEESDIKEIILKAMKEAGIAGNRLSDENTRQISIYFNQYLPKSKKKRVFENIEGDIIPIGTWDMDTVSIRLSELDRDATVFLSEDYEIELGEDTRNTLSYLTGFRHGQDSDGQYLLFKPDQFVDQHPDIVRTFVPQDTRSPYVVNTSLFKNPQNMVIVSHAPEKEFVFQLIEHAAYITAWIKSPDKQFYSIEYEFWKGGKDRVRRGFNPDFFIQIRIEDYIDVLEDKGRTTHLEALKELQDEGIESLVKVVEIKSDDDQDEATPAKAECAKVHFEAVNKKLNTMFSGDITREYRKDWKPFYTFDLLKPAGFFGWFDRLKKGVM
jgi:type III restriction enzyme